MSYYRFPNLLFGGPKADMMVSGVLITTPGAGQRQVPAGVTSIDQEMWGGGGGGATKSSGTASGGGGGAYLKKTLSVTPGDIISFNIGSGGLSERVLDPPIRSQTPGGDTTSGSLTAGGGAAGVDTGTANGGTATGGDVNTSGGSSTDLSNNGGSSPNGGGGGTGQNGFAVAGDGSIPGGGGGGNSDNVSAGSGAVGGIKFTF